MQEEPQHVTVDQEGEHDLISAFIPEDCITLLKFPRSLYWLIIKPSLFSNLVQLRKWELTMRPISFFAYSASIAGFIYTLPELLSGERRFGVNISDWHEELRGVLYAIAFVFPFVVTFHFLVMIQLDRKNGRVIPFSTVLASWCYLLGFGLICLFLVITSGFIILKLYGIRSNVFGVMNLILVLSLMALISTVVIRYFNRMYQTSFEWSGILLFSFLAGAYSFVGLEHLFQNL